jgi:polyisoprenoid-binding protein YceI
MRDSLPCIQFNVTGDRIAMKTFIMLAALALVSSFATAETKFSAGTYDIDVAHSIVGFEIPHMVISSVEGRFNKFEGKINLADKFEKSSVKAVIDVDSIDTGNVKRNDHLKSPDFFDAKKYPQMKFASTAIKGTPESFKLTGNLTIHGVTKKVTFNAKMLGSVNDGNNDRIAFNAKTRISRQDFGLKWNKAIEAGPVVGTELDLTLKIEATKPTSKK